MNKQKIFYEAPTAEVLVVRFEEHVLVVSGGNNQVFTSAGTYDGEFEDE